MDKNATSRISFEMCNGDTHGVPIVEGEAAELLTMASAVIYAALSEFPNRRAEFRRASRRILRDTRPQWQARLLKTVFGAIGIGLLVFLVGNGVVFLASALGIW